MFSSQKRFYFQITFFILSIFILSACATTVKTSAIPSTEIKRSEDTPLVVGIPGLNMPPFVRQEKELERLDSVMAKIGIPSAVILYNTADDPIIDVADLKSEEHSVLAIRVLPRFVSLINEENAVRKSQGLSPLKELVIIGYSQGGVVAWDLLDRFVTFKQRLEEMREKFGEEWTRLEKDPEFSALNDAITSLFLINNVKIQYGEVFKKSVDLQNIYFQAKQNMERASERFRAYLVESGQYPQLGEWQKTFKAVWKGEAYSEGFFFQYAAFKNLLPLKIRLLSLTSSLYGSASANKGMFFMSFAPRIGDAVAGNAMNQLKDTRVGNRHQLEWTKELYDRLQNKHSKPVLEEVYFIVGLHGHKGDGLVDQPSAHLSEVRLAALPLKEALEGNGQSEIKWQSLQKVPVAGLQIAHIEMRKILPPEAANSFQRRFSKARPFLEAFARKDHAELKALHEKYNKPLTQFYCSLYFPKDAGIDQKDLELKPLGKEVKFTGRFVNAEANSLVWIGYFKSAKDQEALFRLTAKTKTGKREFLLKLYPGHQHFIEII